MLFRRRYARSLLSDWLNWITTKHNSVLLSRLLGNVDNLHSSCTQMISVHINSHAFSEMNKIQRCTAKQKLGFVLIPTPIVLAF